MADWQQLQSIASTFYINLARNEKRKVLTEKYLNENGFKKIIRIEAVDGSCAETLRKEWQALQNPIKDKTPNKQFGPKVGAEGCFLSHIKILQRIVDEKIAFAFVFEDDILFHKDFQKLAQVYYEATPKDYGLVYLGSQMLHYEMGYPCPAQLIMRDPCYCTHAMLITYKGARDLLRFYLSQPVYCIDIMIRDYQMFKKGIIPAYHPVYNEIDLKWYNWNGRALPPHRLPFEYTFEKRCDGIVYQNPEMISDIDNLI